MWDCTAAHTEGSNSARGALADRPWAFWSATRGHPACRQACALAMCARGGSSPPGRSRRCERNRTAPAAFRPKQSECSVQRRAQPAAHSAAVARVVVRHVDGSWHGCRRTRARGAADTLELLVDALLEEQRHRAVGVVAGRLESAPRLPVAIARKCETASF